MSLQNKPGVTLMDAPQDWQILQKDETGHATLALSGGWKHDRADAQVEVAVLRQDSGAPAGRETNWQPVTMAADGTWSGSLRVPAGGLYRIATRLYVPGANIAEWALRGDSRHFIGVGDLWVIAGQSNSAGYGRAPVMDPPALGVHLLRNSMQWALASHPMNDSTDTLHPANSEGANSGHSPYLAFAKKLQDQLGHPIGLVQTSLGGSPLSAWNPTENAEAPLFAVMRQCLAAVGGRVAGILWYQGESDCGPQQCDSYLTRFIAAVGAWRELAGDPTLPVLTVQLNRVTTPNPAAQSMRGWSVLREAQRQAAHRIKRVAVVPATDLPLDDGIHTSSSGNMVLGDRLADAALGMVYRKNVPWQAPDLERIEWRDDATLRLQFAAVVGRIDTTHPLPPAFRVTDDDGVIAVTGHSYPSRNHIDLTLERPPRGRLAVSAGYGTAPANLPLDMARMWPILAFHDISEA